MLNMLATLAEYERELIVERVNAGIAAARQGGTRFGRPAVDPAVIADKLAVVAEARAKGRTAEDAARLVGWSRATLYRHQQAASSATPTVAETDPLPSSDSPRQDQVVDATLWSGRASLPTPLLVLPMLREEAEGHSKRDEEVDGHGDPLVSASVVDGKNYRRGADQCHDEHGNSLAAAGSGNSRGVLHRRSVSVHCR